MTLSNKLTLSRIVIVPVFILFMTINTLWAHILALVVFVYAALTDLYDGYLARRYGQVTRLGQFLDPLADKMIVTAAMISFISIRLLKGRPNIRLKVTAMKRAMAISTIPEKI